MARVFLSYDREDTDRARPIAVALEKAGHSVWWDRHIRSGTQFSQEIDEALKRAEAVVVLWSDQSIGSPWVRDEAAVGRDNGKLVPALIDAVDPPLGFRQYQTTDLTRWKGRAKSAEFREMLEALESLGGKEPLTAAAKPARISALADHDWARRWLNPWLIIGLILALLGLFIARPWEVKASVPIVAVRAADSTPDAKALARDLLVGLGNVQSAGGDSLQLVDENSRTKPDLIIEVSGSASGPRPAANLVLLRGSDRQLLSSEDLEAGSNNVANLKASLAVSAVQLLGCATEALAAGPLHSADLKPYLEVCGRFDTVYGSPEPAYALVSQLEQVVEKAPQFTPAWKRLLLLEASLQMLPDDHDKPSPVPLKRHIAEARRIAEMPEADVAEAELLPTTDFAARLALVDRAVSRAPNDSLIFAARASQLMRVGRLSDALSDAEQAWTLDKFSPATRNAFILVLIYSGRLQRAINELDEAQRLSPTAHNLLESRFRLNLRYADPRVSLEIWRAHGSGVAPEAFLQARIDPTPAKIDRAIAVAGTTAARFGSLIGGQVETLATFGREDQVYELLMQLPQRKFEANLAGTLFRPTLKNFRHQPRFLIVAQRFGLLGYWRSSGKWPDFCSDPDLPYDCKAEAAKLAA